MNQNVQTRVNQLVDSEIPAIRAAYNEGMRLLSLTNGSNSLDSTIYACIKTCQEKLSSAIDIALRNFCIVKQLPVPISGNGGSVIWKQIDDTDAGNEIKAYPRQYCVAITKYNDNKTVNKQLLTNVALGEFLDGREDMNIPKHIGIVSSLKRVYRRYNNLCNVIVATDSTLSNKLLDLADYKNSFAFDQFDAWMNGFDASCRRYVLITKSMQDIPVEQIQSFLQIPWALIIDMDGASEYGGLKQQVSSFSTMFRELPLSSLNINSSYSFNITTPYINIDSKDYNSPHYSINAGARKNPAVDRIFKNIGAAMHNSIYSKLTIVITGLQDERTSKICDNLISNFEGTDIIYLTSQDEAPYSIGQEDGPGFGCTDNVFKAECELCDAMESINDNKDFLPRKLRDAKIENSNNFILPGRNGKIEIPAEIASVIEEHAEILHLNIGSNPANVNTWEFLHGELATWETINSGFVPKLIKLDNFEHLIKEGKDNCYYLYHLPGFGGTTHGRIIAWNLHTQIPVLILRQYDAKTFSAFIANVYKQINRFVLIIDENEFSNIAISEMSIIIRNNEYGVHGLFIQRISEEDALQRLRDYRRNEKVLKMIDANAISTLCNKCHEWLSAHEQSHVYNIRKEVMERTLTARMKCPLLINLYLLEENFSLENYVRRFIDPLRNDSDGQALLKLTAIISIFDYFGNCDFPLAFTNRYLRMSERSEKSAKKDCNLSMSCFWKRYR